MMLGGVWRGSFGVLVVGGSTVGVVKLLFNLCLNSVVSMRTRSLSGSTASVVASSQARILYGSVARSVRGRDHAVLVLGHGKLGTTCFIYRYSVFHSLRGFSKRVLGTSNRDIQGVGGSRLRGDRCDSSLDASSCTCCCRYGFPSFPFAMGCR